MELRCRPRPCSSFAGGANEVIRRLESVGEFPPDGLNTTAPVSGTVVSGKDVPVAHALLSHSWHRRLRANSGKQIEAHQNQPAAPGHERTAESEEVETPSESEFNGEPT